jgi:hypothetical protein
MTWRATISLCTGKGGSMSAIMIKCPNTDRDVFTGIEIDFVSFNRLPNVLSHSYCPACGREHHWRRSEAWLAPYGAESLSVDVAASDRRNLKTKTHRQSSGVARSG